MQKNKGILTVVSGFSGAGKGTIMKALMQAHSETYALSISATTRAPRTGERDGIEYFFKSREAFEQMIADDALVEYAEYVGNVLRHTEGICGRAACQGQGRDLGD